MFLFIGVVILGMVCFLSSPQVVVRKIFDAPSKGALFDICEHAVVPSKYNQEWKTVVSDDVRDYLLRPNGWNKVSLGEENNAKYRIDCYYNVGFCLPYGGREPSDWLKFHWFGFKKVRIVISEIRNGTIVGDVEVKRGMFSVPIGGEHIKAICLDLIPK